MKRLILKLFILLVILAFGLGQFGGCSSCSRDTVSPIVLITSPSDNALVSEIVIIRASATDNVGVAKVEFYIDGSKVGEDTTSPYEYIWDTSNLDYGSTHTIKAKAYDAAGNVGESAVITVKIGDTLSPQVTITNPQDGSAVSGIVAITADVTDRTKGNKSPSGILRVEFYIDGSKVGEDTTSPYECSWNTRNLALNSQHTIQAKAYDNAGNVGESQTVTITVGSPLSGKIAFTSYRNGNVEIYIMNADGSNQTRLTYTGFNYTPRFSPDGTKIVFYSYRDGNAEIYIMNADGSNQTRLTYTGYNRFPCFSPDGTKIAFTSERDGNGEIYVMNADGSNQTRLTNNLAEDRFPCFSPDGSKIAFTSTRDGNDEIYVMNADGSNQTRLTNNLADDSYPCFSPDGTKIAFSSDRDGNYDIYIMNTNGSNQTRLTYTGYDAYSCFSPDGSKIAFTSYRDGNDEIYIMNADGSNQTNITNNPGASDSMPSWGP